jgi:hypothetical protein
MNIQVFETQMSELVVKSLACHTNLLRSLQMSGNTVLAIISVAAMITVGIITALEHSSFP